MAETIEKNVKSGKTHMKFESNEVLEVELWDYDPNCSHEDEGNWSGIKCKKCKGWFCY